MFIKRTLRLSAFLFALFTIQVSFAGGPEASPQYTGVYLGANAGYAFRNWRDNGLLQQYITTFQGGNAFGSFNNGRDGGTVGVVLGYQFNEFIGLEGGWNYLPQMHYIVPDGNTLLLGNDMTVNSWLAYIAVKLAVPIYPNMYLFGKLGAVYLRNRASFSSGTSAAILSAMLPTMGSYWAPLFAGGIQYYFNWHWSINFQYLYARGYRKVPLGASLTHFPSPDTNLFTLGFEFRFM